MASYERETRKTFARDLVAFNDVELDQYLEEHRLEGGATTVDVEDPENLPESFIQRLRDRAQNTSDVARAVDLNRVTARLLEIPADHNALPQPYFRRAGSIISSTDSGPPTPRQVYEISRYDELVNDSGRPLYPIDLVNDVAEDPKAHQDMLRPWLNCLDADPPEWEVFHEQLVHWRDFRNWQAQARGLGFPKYRCIAYDIFHRYFRCGSSSYTEAVKNLLIQYGFARHFQFHDDPKQQDRLTTWIEYLGFACAQHYRYARNVKNRQPEYDKAWETLVDANVLRPFETEEYICAIDSAFQRQNEEDRAYKAVKSAEAVLISAQKAKDHPRGPRRGKPAVGIHSRAAQTRLDAAKESLASIKRRNDHVTEFRTATRAYRTTKDDAAHYRVRLRWISEQVPLVVAEMNGPGGSHKRSLDDAIDDEPPSKRVRDGSQDSVPRNDGARMEPARGPQGSRASKVGRTDDDKKAVTTAVGYPSPTTTRFSNDLQLQRKSTQGAPQPSTAFPPLRRSARIVARKQNRSGAAQRSPHTTQKPAPPLPIEARKQHSKPQMTKTTKHRARTVAGVTRQRPREHPRDVDGPTSIQFSAQELAML
ncbi:hypothetical protein GGR57DRAFT_484021 [Xylariaceae sp. FL1272]|nr:hypothetical protein GGR57DRAFT_484021 [Xylariaceae sp. FL1272]